MTLPESLSTPFWRWLWALLPFMSLDLAVKAATRGEDWVPWVAAALTEGLVALVAWESYSIQRHRPPGRGATPATPPSAVESNRSPRPGS